MTHASQTQHDFQATVLALLVSFDCIMAYVSFYWQWHHQMYLMRYKLSCHTRKFHMDAINVVIASMTIENVGRNIAV